MRADAIPCALLPSAIGPIELLIRDSLHSARGRRFELDHASVALQPNGVLVVEAMDVNPRGRPFAEVMPIRRPLVRTTLQLSVRASLPADYTS
jgi:hypothetical protein